MAHLFPARRGWVALCAALPMALVSLFGHSVFGQAPAVAPTPRTQAPAPGAPAGREYSNTDIASRPYNGVDTPPQYPSTRPVQKQFSVTYLYNYAQSDYTPPVPLPTVSKAAQTFNTPENALIAMLSAARRANRADWLACWDSASQADFAQREKAQPGYLDKAFEYYKQVAAQHLVLQDRVETVAYIVLDVTTDDPKSPMKGRTAPDVLVFEKGSWLSSSQFSSDGLLTKLGFGIPGQSQTLTFGLRPEGKGTPAVNRAQEAFLNQHTQSQKVTVPVE